MSRILGWMSNDCKKIIFVLFVILLLSCHKESDVFDVPPSVNIVNTKYGDKPQNEIMIAYDTIKVNPVVVFVHGGAWNSGDYRNWIDESKIGLFTHNNIAFVALNYSLSPNPPRIDDDSRIKHPAHVNDVATALSWLKTHASEYNLDVDNLFLMGHSAGAYLVDLLAIDETYLEEKGLSPSDIKGVVSLDAGSYLIGDSIRMKEVGIWPLFLNAFSADEKLYKQAMLPFLIEPGKDIPPFLLVSGEDYYRREANEQFKQMLTDNGYSAEHFSASGYEHSVVFTIIGATGDRYSLGKEIVNFIKQNHD